jgi:hypothetical protein
MTGQPQQGSSTASGEVGSNATSSWPNTDDSFSPLILQMVAGCRLAAPIGVSVR